MKLARFLGHNGTNFCGEAAVKIYPDLLEWFSSQVKKGIILVAGTNGKTSVNNMINAILKEAGYSVVCNELGANLDSGIVSAFIGSSDVLGNINADFACLEIDEAVLPKILKFIKPDFIIFTNIFRDQLDRYCEIEMILNKIKTALKDNSGARLIINADDPSLVEMGESVPNLKYYYGMNESMDTTDNHVGADSKNELIKDSIFCRRCGNRLQYERYYYGQLGYYFCRNCGFKRPVPDFCASIEKTPMHLKVSGRDFFRANIFTGFINSYTAYNTLAAVSCAALLDIPTAVIEKGLLGYKPQIGRMEKFFINKPIVFNLVKNPVGFNETLKAIGQDNREKTIAIGINDYVQDGRDVSWLWDTNFEILLDFDDKIIKYIVFGRRRHDMALRLKYAGIQMNKIKLADSPKLAVHYMVSDRSSVAYIFANYSLLFETRSILKRRSKDVSDYHMPSVS
jgi:UDP-N-acetylmuramyl tripeptide synthase